MHFTRHILRNWLLTCCLVLLPLTARPQQQFQGLCARVKIEILQELTTERIGFEATLELTNNDGEDPITDFFADLTFENPAQSTNGVVNDASGLFFVRTPQLTDLNAIDGTGMIGPTKRAVMKWFIIPKISAGGTTPEGIRYRVGARLSGKFKGAELPAEVLRVMPDTIYVKPEPQLEITYFQPRDVQGDDPFTPNVESPIPFTLGVLVKNTGYGIARNVKINSQQPKIVENKQHLLLVAQLLGARVMDAPLQRADLLVSLGDINPGQARKGAWDMITTLSGEFTEFKASFTHASDLGGEETSVIKSMSAHFIAHEVLNDQPGRDRILDFLADTDRDPDMIPDALYESEGFVLPVNNLVNGTVLDNGNPFHVELIADRAGWGYVRLSDPGQARLRIESVRRSDGKLISTNNVWTNVRYEPGSNKRLAYLNILDRVELGTYSYTVTYAPSPSDSTPPVTTLNFSGAVKEVDGQFVITPDTQMFFLAEDESPVSIYCSVTNGAFLPALPFWLKTPGQYLVQYYATDASMNTGVTNSAILVVVDNPPALNGATLNRDNLFAAGDALSIRPSTAELLFQAQAGATPVDAQIDIFRGVVAWASVRGVPSSPTRSDSAILTVEGSNVDYYCYRVNGGTWSTDQPVANPICLSNLLTGTYTVAVRGRSRYGAYLPETNAVEVSWYVSSSALATTITGAPATPTASRSALLTISGTDLTDYRWTVNGYYYRASTPVSTPLELNALTGTQQVVSVIGKIGGAWQGTNSPTVVSWTIDPTYGSDFSALPCVRSVTLTNIGTASMSFTWDGRNNNGVLQRPGWYLIRLTLRDQLGHMSFTTRLVNLAELSSEQVAVADVNRNARNPHARGRWMVWQDQSTGNFEIFAQDLGDTNAMPRQVSSAGLNQENPATDGRYVVWQSRQSDGNWDIMWSELASTNAPHALTSSHEQDEINPSIDWPWIVYQAKPVGLPSAKWQLRAHNLFTGESVTVDPSAQDQQDPEVQAGRVVWQDYRDLGVGEIYFKNLETGERRRLTTNTFGQYLPAISENWVAWQDNRNGQVDIYGYDLTRNREVRLTATTENEARPYLEGSWLVCEEDSLGALTANLRMIHLPSLRAVPLTRSESVKTRPALAGGRICWQENGQGSTRLVSAGLPALQAVFVNQNAVPVTEMLANSYPHAFDLLKQWNAQAGVQEIVSYSALVPQLITQTARWENGHATGDNFNIAPGMFLWVKFAQRRVLDLGDSTVAALDLGVGVNVLSSTRFPNQFTAFKLLQQMGLNQARAVRMFDGESGRWVIAQVQGDGFAGEDFKIPSAAVLFVDMASPVSGFKPE